MTQKLVIVSCTQHSEINRSELLIVQSFEHGGFSDFATLDLVFNNKEGLPENYNKKILQYAQAGIEFLVFVHDDVYIDDLKLYDKLVIAHQKLGYQIIGAAGASKLTLGYPSLWHLMSEPKDRRGYVHHFTENGLIYCTSFGPTPSKVVAIDGLFMAVHLPSVLSHGWKFNENYSFHHYDLASCLDASELKLQIGVYPIHMIHNSPGLNSFSNPSWCDSDQRFLKEYRLKK